MISRIFWELIAALHLILSAPLHSCPSGMWSYFLLCVGLVTNAQILPAIYTLNSPLTVGYRGLSYVFHYNHCLSASKYFTSALISKNQILSGTIIILRLFNIMETNWPPINCHKKNPGSKLLSLLLSLVTRVFIFN